tara:strand:- start:9 stop:734 length:726 start_codon:yes stop_codon:yes gene_type:complete
MEKNKTGKYFKYAIGEIILVVIGILLALSINNWNEDRKEKAIVKNVLKNIRYDLIADTIKFSSDLKKIPSFLNSAKFLLNNTEFDTISANSLFNKLPYSAYSYKIKNQSYEKVINTGITDFFEYNELFDDINTYYTIDSNGHDVVKKWDSDETTKDGSYWITMGFEIDIFSDNLFYKENEIEFTQQEVDRKAVFLEQLKTPNIRNSIKMNLYRKMRLIETLQNMKQRAKDIILKIDEQLKE